MAPAVTTATPTARTTSRIAKDHDTTSLDYPELMQLQRDLPRDLLHALRGLRQSPALALVAIVSLALGIGANITVYSVAREMIFDNISARAPARLARIDARISYTGYRDLRRLGIFDDLAFDTGLNNLNWTNLNSSSGSRTEVAWYMSTSANFFDVLGVRASIGRLYTQSDEGRPVAVASYGFWRKRLNADPSAIGRPLELNGRLYTLLGVLPRDYRSVLGHGISPEIYRAQIYRKDAPGLSNCQPFGRLRGSVNDGSTLSQTRDALAAAASRLFPPDLARNVATLRPMAGLAAQANSIGEDRRYFVFFLALLATAILLAIIACLNVAGLLLVRGFARRREFAIRKALGASRFQLTRQLFAEGVALALLGALAGLAADAFLRDRLRYVRWPSAYNLPFEFHFQSDRGLFFYALAAASLALLLSALLPSMRSSTVDPFLAIKQGEPAFSLRRWNLWSTFVALQLALSLILLTLGGLFVRSFRQVATSSPGFDIAHTEIAIVYSTSPQKPLWRDNLVRHIKAVPGVIGVTSIGTLPFMGELPIEAIRRQGDDPASARDAYSVGAGEQFCQTLAMPILHGRDFDIADRSRHPQPVLINQALAHRLFGNADPLGATLVAGRDPQRILEVIGVTADAKLRTLGEAHAPAFFTPYSDPQMLIRVAGSPAQWIEPLRNALAGTDSIAAIDIRPLSEAAAGAIFPMRVAAGFIGSLAALGLLLSLSGLYSSVSYAARRRTREMAIRSALGASRAAILWNALGNALAILACGVILGLPIAIAAIRPIADLIPDGVNPWNPVYFAVVVVILLATGAGAAFLPARFAANVDPALALRQE
jgi:putative ABC transport system permease protein